MISPYEHFKGNFPLIVSYWEEDCLYWGSLYTFHVFSARNLYHFLRLSLKICVFPVILSNTHTKYFTHLLTKHRIRTQLRPLHPSLFSPQMIRLIWHKQKSLPLLLQKWEAVGTVVCSSHPAPPSLPLPLLSPFESSTAGSRSAFEPESQWFSGSKISPEHCQL